MTDSLVDQLKRWVKGVMRAMGDALVSEKNRNEPPKSGEQPYKDTPKKGLF